VATVKVVFAVVKSLGAWKSGPCSGVHSDCSSDSRHDEMASTGCRWGKEVAGLVRVR
jgi:hypothetical protein